MKRRYVIGAMLVVVVVVLIVVLTTLHGWGVFLPAYRNDLDLFMASRRAAMEVPGMAVGIFGPDGIVWDGYYGTYDGEHPVSQDTVFVIASVSKTVVATAIMQLWEQGRFDLDDDVNDYLAFEVRNPHNPEAAITFRQLMTHHSSISDVYPFYDDMYTITSGGGDSPWALGAFLEAYLAPGGQFYGGENYLETAPGEAFEYSNYGAALLAHLVEVLSGEDFADYCQAHVFGPLGMAHTYYLLSDIPASETELAVPFVDGTPLPHYSYPDYPAGNLRTTIGDLGRFAAFYLEPEADDAAILQPETVEMMFGAYGEATDVGEGQMGLVWVHMDWLFFKAIGHTGGDPGVSTCLLLYPDEGFGTIVFMNGAPQSYYLFRDVIGRLRDEGRRR
jgi:CubicO group peptidase (beta-lactamase class C family)